MRIGYKQITTEDKDKWPEILFMSLTNILKLIYCYIFYVSVYKR